MARPTHREIREELDSQTIYVISCMVVSRFSFATIHYEDDMRSEGTISLCVNSGALPKRSHLTG